MRPTKRTALAALFAFAAAFLVAGVAMGGGNERPRSAAEPRITSTGLAALPSLAEDPGERKRALARRAARRARRLAAERRAAAADAAAADTAATPAPGAPAPAAPELPAAAPEPPPPAPAPPPPAAPAPTPPPPPPPETFDDSG